MSDDIVSARGLAMRYGRRPARGRRAAGRFGDGAPAGERARASRARPAAPPDAASVHALEAVDLDGRAGEIVGVLGPNGAGKSTLLRVLATVLRPTAGTLRLFGSPARPAPDLRRRLGYAADTAAHFDALSGRENAIFFARAAGLGAARAAGAVHPLLERFALADDADRAVREYSFGMRRKLALAEALAHEPDLILLDEPTVGLDPRALRALREMLRERAATGAAVVAATNDVREAQALCDRVVFLHRGRVALEGEPDALLRRARAQARVHVTFRGPGRVGRGRATRSDGVGATTAPPEAAPAAADESIPADDVLAAAGGSAAPTAVLAAARAVDGAELVTAGPDHLLFHAARGGGALPDICRALLDAGAEVLSVHVREPDLRDVFHEATGEALEAAAADAGDEPHAGPGDRGPATSERAPASGAVRESGP